MANRALHSSVTRKKAAAGLTLLAGDTSTAYATADVTSAGRQECFQFTAAASGTVEEMRFRTSATANTEITSLILGILENRAPGEPGNVLGQGTAAGEPAVSSWITVTGLSIPVTEGTAYWLALLPIGTAGKQIHFNAATTLNLGTGNQERTIGGLTKITAANPGGYETFNQGPCGFQALGTVGTTGGGQVVLPGAVIIQLGTPKEDWTRAAEAGCRVGRVEESSTKTLSAETKLAEETGMKLCYLYKGTQTVTQLCEAYEALSASRKATVICFEYLNESWPGGVGAQFNGKQYGEKWLAATKVQRERNLDVPFLMQTRIDKSIGTKWMDEWNTLNTAELTVSLEPKPEGKSILTTGNWLSSHPYFGNMMLAQKEPNNIGSSGATTAYRDTASNEWGSQRFMKEILYVKNKTGLNVPCAFTEYGVRWSGTFGEVNSVGSHEKHAEYVKALWEFMKVVEEEKVPSPPTGLTPKVPFVAWYDQYSHRTANEETYGFYYYAEEGKSIEKNETNSLWKTFKEGAEKL